MSLLVTFTEKARGIAAKNAGITEQSVEINAEKILSVKQYPNSTLIKVEKGDGSERFSVTESAATVKSRIERAEIKRAVAIRHAAATISAP